MLREEVWSETPHRTGSRPVSRRLVERRGVNVNTPDAPVLAASRIPSRLHDLINSRACRSAIMFNDELTLTQCQGLVRRLGNCTLPFHCAHGRPSMVVLASLSGLHDHDPLAIEPSDLAFTSVTSTDLRGRPGLGPASNTLRTNDSLRKRQATSSGNASYQPKFAKSTTTSRIRSSLNTIDNCERTFGNAYRSWTGSPMT